MYFFNCFVLFFALCGVSDVFARKVRLISRHSLVKRQVPSHTQSGHTDTGGYSHQSSNSDQDGTPSPRRHFVSPDGQPYYEYQPHVSTSRGVSGARTATSYVSVGEGSSSRATSPVSSSEVRRSQTYTYPFGRERTRYVEQQQAQTDGSQTTGDDYDSGRSYESGAQHEGAGTRRNRQTQFYSSSSHGASAYERIANQRSSSDAEAQQEQELRRRQEELRRRHEEERQRQEEERQRQAEERRVLEEQRRREHEERLRQYYEQQQQRRGQQATTSPADDEDDEDSEEDATPSPVYRAGSRTNPQQQPTYTAYNRQEEERRRQEEERRVLEEERRREHEERLRQYYEQQQQRRRQQESTAGSEGDEDSGRNASSTHQTGSSTNTHQQPTYTRQRVPSRQQPVSGGTFSQGTSDSSGQAGGVYRTSSGQQHQQQGGYVPTNQQGVYRTQTQREYGYRPQYQRPIYSSLSRTVTSQEPVYTATRTTYRQGSQSVPSSSSGTRYYYQPSGGQVDTSRSTSSQGGVYYPGFRTQYEYSSGGQGQGQSFYNPYYNTYNGFSNTDTGSVFGTEDAYSECPETGIDLRINGMDCQQAVQHHGSFLCYTHEYTSRQCCEVCRPLKQANRIGCEYGDHAELCSSITPADCYDLRNRQSCCETCERFRRNDTPAGCEYGDMTIRCDDVRQNPGLCYIPDNQRLCCETCNTIRNVTNPSCPWGDYNPSLCQVFDDSPGGVRINCYSPQRRRLCCDACERLRQWLPADLPADCPYGDRPVIFSTGQFGRLNCTTIFNIFSTDECRTNSAVSVNCCHTCHRYLRGRG